MELSSFDRFFWLAGFLAHVILLLILVAKRRLGPFPWFGAFVLFNILRAAVLYYVYRIGDYEYFYAYWGLVVVDVCLQVLVFCEVASKIFRPSGQLSADIKRPLLLIALISFGLAILLVSLASPPELEYDQRLVLRLALFCNFFIAELFGGLILLSVTSGFVWKSQAGIIAKGLGTFAVLALLFTGIQNYFGTNSKINVYRLTSRLQVFCYMACLCYWILGLAQEAPVTRPMTNEMTAQLDKLDKYMKSALAHLRLGGSPS